MSINQLHGKKAEDIIKSCYMGASDQSRFSTSKWDIEAKFDKKNKLPISVKTKKNAKNITIELADARRFFSIKESFKLIL